MSKFVTGDVVTLRTGGPKMLVIDVRADSYLICFWREENGRDGTSSFAPEMLVANQPHLPLNTATDTDVLLESVGAE